MNKDAIIKATQTVTKKWAKVRKAEERQSSRSANRSEHMYSTRIDTKYAAWKVMEEAYMKASTNNTLPANARQIMYAARPMILKIADANHLDDKYFTQTLLPDYMEEHEKKTADWDVVFDARGQFVEPHTKLRVELGTIGVRSYLGRIANNTLGEDEEDVPPYPTIGPRNRYSAIMFIEKEGFAELFKRANLAEKYDIAIMSTKGMSTTAARLLVDDLCDEETPLFVLRDFDKSGFSILGTLQRDTRRYTFYNNPTVIDMGLRLEHVKKYKLESEDVEYRSDPGDNLRENDATEEEVKFLSGKWDNYRRRFRGQRVELNALSSGDLIDLIETCLAEHGIKKVIPDAETLEDAYRRAVMSHKLNEHMEAFKVIAQMEVDAMEIPSNIQQKIKTQFKKTPYLSWDSAISRIIEKDVKI